MNEYLEYRLKSLLLMIMGLVFSVQVFAQAITVKGVVKDSAGEPVIGANVVVVGTTNGTITDFDGNFTIKANKNAKLEISFIGYKNTVVKVSPNMNIVLKDDTQLLDDVVVIGYGAVKKKEMTGAVAQVKSEDITKINTSDLGNALQGMVSGVSVTAESGAPGAGSEILIRGVASVNGQNTPLYVVDGVPQEGDPRISPNEIETIDILKDAASCAIYGTRGAAGVILITTKKGKEGKMSASFDASYGIKKITSTDYLMNTQEQTYFNLLFKRNTGTSNTYDDTTLLDLYRSLQYYHNDTNLLDQVFVDNAATQNYSLTLSGGNNGLTYSIMNGFYKQDGSVINSGFNRYNTRINLGYKRKRLTMNASVGLSVEDTDYSPAGLILQAIKYSPTQPEIKPGDTFETVGGNEQNRLTYVLDSFFSEDYQRMTNSFANFNINYELFKGFNVSGRVALKESGGYRRNFRPYKEIKDQDGELITKPEDSYISMISTNRNSIVWDFGAQYRKTVKGHKVTAFAGVTGEEYVYEGFTAKKQGVVDNDIKVLNGGSLNPSATSSDNYVNRLIGSIGRLQYDWRGRYLISASIRCDGSSRFASNNRWGFFPSASAAWNISDEPFFKPLADVVNNFKLRGSYGTTGNQNFTPYTFSGVITNGYDYVIGDASNQSLAIGSIQSEYSNQNVKWETTRQYNIGVDLALFNNKFTLAAEYYSTDKKDMLFPVTLPGSTGATKTLVMNVGNMTNSGYELTARYRSAIKGFSYDFSGTFSTNKNKVTRINGDGTRISAYPQGLVSGAAAHSQVTFIAEGYEAGAFFLYPTDGIINTPEKLAEYQKINPTAQMGDLIFVDTNKDGKISDDDRVYSGSGLPKYEIGFNMQFRYKGFDLYANLYSALGHKIMNGSRATAFGYGRHKDLVAQYTEFNTDSPIPTYRGDVMGHENYRADTDLWLEDGSYLRLKSITLGYSLSKALVTRMRLSNLRFYISGQNLFTLTKYSGYDPEIGGGINKRGMDMGNYPTFATYSVGLNLSF